MKTSEIQETLLEVLKNTPGIKKLHEYDLLDSNGEDIDSEQWKDLILTEATNEGWVLKVAITTIRGIHVKSVVNNVYKQLTFALKDTEEKIFQLNILIRGVKDE